jgi:hypothetical protein
MVSWCGKKQTFVALSITEAEYIAIWMAVHKAMWLRKLLVGFFGQMLYPTVIHCDNHRCVKLSKNPISHDSLKHVDIKYQYIRDMVQRKEVLVQYLPIDEKIADVLTKPLAKSKFKYFRDKLRVVENGPLIEREC